MEQKERGEQEINVGSGIKEGNDVKEGSTAGGVGGHVRGHVRPPPPHHHTCETPQATHVRPPHLVIHRECLLRRFLNYPVLTLPQIISTSDSISPTGGLYPEYLFSLEGVTQHTRSVKDVEDTESTEISCTSVFNKSTEVL
jgi:hypothetical protein